MHQQPAVANRIVVLAVAVRIMADVSVEQPELAISSQRISVLQINASIASRFDFGADQLYSGFVGFEDVIVVIGLAICRNDFCACAFSVI